MDTLTVVFTSRRWNPVSWLIRWAVPRSRFALSLSSHAIILDGETAYEANMLHGCRKTDKATALKGLTVQRQVDYPVPDKAAALDWLGTQCVPGKPYDWGGALGLGLSPYRDWAQDDRWYCYELAAGALRAGGLDVFPCLSHIGETALLAIAA
jgi:hypothetical protein